jgi:hypothetical protein
MGRITYFGEKVLHTATRFFWLFGQVSSIVLLASGALLALLESEPFLSWRQQRAALLEAKTTSHILEQHRKAA